MIPLIQSVLYSPRTISSGQSVQYSPRTISQDSQSTTPLGQSLQDSQSSTPLGQSLQDSQSSTPLGQSLQDSQSSTPLEQSLQDSQSSTPFGKSLDSQFNMTENMTWLLPWQLCITTKPTHAHKCASSNMHCSKNSGTLKGEMSYDMVLYAFDIQQSVSKCQLQHFQNATTVLLKVYMYERMHMNTRVVLVK